MGLAKCDRRVASPTGTGRARQWLRSAPDNDTAAITAVSHDFMCSQDLYDAVWAETHRTSCAVWCAVRYRKRGLPRFVRFSVIPGARPISPITEAPGCAMARCPPGSCSWPAPRRWLVGRRTTTVLGAGAAPARGRYTTAETDLRGNR